MGQDMLAERAGIGIQTLRRIEGGGRAKQSTMGKLVNALALEGIKLTPGGVRKVSTK
jgi:hypothetical protein